MARGLTSYRSPILGTTHMVSAGHYLAAAAGYRILEDGGNAIDAGVASGIAINVTLPHATNFGGVAPIAIYDAASDAVVTISGLGRWPRAANIDYFNQHAGGQIPTGILRTVMPAAADAWLTALEEVRHDDLRACRHPRAGAGGERLPRVGVPARRPADHRGGPRGRRRHVAVHPRSLHAERGGRRVRASSSSSPTWPAPSGG